MYSSSRELITLQFGDYASYVASNFWNLEYTNATFVDDSKSVDDDTGGSANGSFESNTKSSHTNPYQNDAHKKRHQKPSVKTRNDRTNDNNQNKNANISSNDEISKFIESSHKANIDGNICFFNRKQHLNTNATRFSIQESNHNDNNKTSNVSGEFMPRTIIFGASGSEGNISKEIEYFENKSYKASTNQPIVKSDKYYSYTQPQNSSSSSSNKNRNLLFTNPHNDLNSIFTWNDRVSTHFTPSYHDRAAVLSHSQRYQPKSILGGSNSEEPVVHYWSDNLLPNINLHDKSLFTLPGIHHFSTPFEKYSTGYEYVNNTSESSELIDNIYDRIRYFMEQCDWFQGFQVFCSMNDGYSGMIPTITKLLNDEFKVGHGHRKTLLIYDCQPNYRTIPLTMQSSLLANNQNNSVINDAISQTIHFRNEINSIVGMSKIWEDITCYVPINTNYWRINNSHNNDKNSNSINNLLFGNANNIDLKLKETSIMGTAIHSSMNICRLNTGNVNSNDQMAKYLRLRYCDVFDKLQISANAHKMSMLSCNSSHLGLNINYQSMSEIENILSYDASSYNQATNTYDSHPIFPKLECLSPIDQSWFDMKYNFHQSGKENTTTLEDMRTGKSKNSKYREQKWHRGELFSEHSTLNGSCIYGSHDIIKQASSLGANKAFYKTEMEKHHQKLMGKLYLNAKQLESIQSYLIFDAWKLPQNHYYSMTSGTSNDTMEEQKYEEKNGSSLKKDSGAELYSIWTSLWNASVIGDHFLNDCAKKIESIEKNKSIASFEKLFGCEKGQCDLDLVDMRDQLLSSADSYAKIEM